MLVPYRYKLFFARSLSVSEARSVAGYELPKNKTQTDQRKHDEAKDFERSIFFNLYCQYQKLSPGHKKGIDIILQMLNREIKYRLRKDMDTLYIPDELIEPDSIMFEA